MVRATDRNIAEIIDWIKPIGSLGETNATLVCVLLHYINNLKNKCKKKIIKQAFKKAFEMLKDHVDTIGSIGCHTAILLLTDGITDDPTQLIKEKNGESINAVIFTYTVGDDESSQIPQKIADITNGIYTHINDNDESLITKMSSYYLYYAYGNTNNDDIIITSPYPDYGMYVVYRIVIDSYYIFLQKIQMKL